MCFLGTFNKERPVLLLNNKKWGLIGMIWVYLMIWMW